MSNNIEVTFDSNMPDIEADFVMQVVNDDHSILINRNLPDQHPMESITGLTDTISNISSSVYDNHEDIIELSQTKVDKVITGNIVYGTDENGDQTTYNVDSFGQVDDVQVGGVSVVTNKIAELGTMAGETASDYYTKTETDDNFTGKSYEDIVDNHIADTDNPHQVTKSQVGLGNVDNTADLDKPISTATKTYVDNADNGLQGQITTINTTIGGYGNIVTHNVSEFATAAQGALADTALQPNDNISELTNNLGYQTATQVANSIAVETSNRESADINLQSQIDAIVSSSDVFDIVGTYAELQAYDISTVPVNDIIKVLVDSTHAGAATYYRCVETGGVKSWSYIGSEGAYYTKAEADNNFVPQTRTVNNKALSSDITLTASDVGAYADNNPSGYITSSAIANMQTTTNLVTSVSSSSTDSQYPSAKLFYDTCGDIETLINAL